MTPVDDGDEARRLWAFIVARNERLRAEAHQRAHAAGMSYPLLPFGEDAPRVPWQLSARDEDFLRRMRISGA